MQEGHFVCLPVACGQWRAWDEDHGKSINAAWIRCTKAVFAVVTEKAATALSQFKNPLSFLSITFLLFTFGKSYFVFASRKSLWYIKTHAGPKYRKSADNIHGISFITVKSKHELPYLLDMCSHAHTDKLWRQCCKGLQLRYAYSLSHSLTSTLNCCRAPMDTCLTSASSSRWSKEVERCLHADIHAVWATFP